PLPSGATEGDWHLEFQSLPQGAAGITAIGVGMAMIVGVFWLYRLEGRKLSTARHLAFTIVRGLVFAGVAIMLLDVVLVIERHEQIPSQLVLLVDSSESMGLTDPYRDDAETKRIADGLGWTVADAASALKRLRETKRFELATAALDKRIDKLSEGRKL